MGISLPIIDIFVSGVVSKCKSEIQKKYVKE
jgi:hypothetical protein